MNNKGYLLVEIIVASVIAMSMMYFLLEITIKLKNINEDYYVETKLETDQILMLRGVMNDLSNNTLLEVSVDDKKVTFKFIDSSDNEFNTRITIENKTYKYGKWDSSLDYLDDVYVKSFDDNLNISNTKIENLCYKENEYKDCNGLDTTDVSKGLLKIDIPATTIYSDTDYGVKLLIPYSYKNITVITEKPAVKLTCDYLISGSDNDGEKGVFTAIDDFGTSCYFKGDVEDNYLKFAEFYWRIIRINGDGTIRIIYDGTSAHSNHESSNDRKLASDSKWSDYYKNGVASTFFKDNTHVGYMYSGIDATNYENTHQNLYDSDIKKVVDNWYLTKIQNAGYSNSVADAIYCNDRSKDGTCYSNWAPCYYGGYLRIKNNNSTSLQCERTNDQFTLTSSSRGNKKLTYPVGLITADEVSLAGTTSYLGIGSVFWTMTPYMFQSEGVYIYNVYNEGQLTVTGGSGSTGIGVSASANVDNSFGVRPVISLLANSEFTGDGTMENPYQIKE